MTIKMDRAITSLAGLMIFLWIALTFGHDAVALAAPEPNPASENKKASERPAAATDEKKLEDRRWIIKDQPASKTKGKDTKAKKIDWKDETQKKTCEALGARIKEAFLSARYGSIQGDPCGTMNNAKRFLDLQEELVKTCPQAYVEALGYSEQTKRNIKVLNKTGQERCIKQGLQEDKARQGGAPPSDSKEQAR